MHSLVLDLWKSEEQVPVLVRLPLDGGALLACFSRRASSDGVPRWLAKTARGESACERLRAEAEALSRLEPESAGLRVPRMLGWRVDGDGEHAEACLVQTGVPGRPITLRRARREPARDERQKLQQVMAWLADFQEAGPRLGRGQPLPSLAEVASGVADRAEGLRGELIAPLLASARNPPPEATRRQSVVLHGDFWSGNVLCQGREMFVVDWSGFGSGSALYDVCTWLAAPPAPPGLRAERWRRVFFAPGSEREALRRFAWNRGYPLKLAAWAFDLFLLRRILWELGMDRQDRSEEERARARREWEAGMAERARAAHPNPFLD